VFQSVLLFTTLPLLLAALAAVFWFGFHPFWYRNHVAEHEASHAERVRAITASGTPRHEDEEMRRLEKHWAASPMRHRLDRWIVTVIVMFFLLQVRRAWGESTTRALEVRFSTTRSHMHPHGSPRHLALVPFHFLCCFITCAVWFAPQSAVLKKGFSVFACAEVDPGEWWLSSDMSYRCFTPG